MSDSIIASGYVIAAYGVLIASCVLGSFSRLYDANLAQRLALAVLCVWAVWRIKLVIDYGWGHPHETTIASALALYAGGSAYKTIRYALRNRRRDRRSGDTQL